jgi:hypothetical protein
MAVRIQFRRGTASQWTSYNPVLSIGEFGYETDTRLFKVGDGTLDWQSLPYAASTITDVIAGTGLTGGGDTGAVTINIDTTVVVTDVVAGTGLTGGGTGGEVTLNVDTTEVMTGVTAGTGLTGGGTGGNQTLSVDTSAVLTPSIADSKGDLLVASGPDTVTKLAVADNGYVLVVDSSQSTGLRWSTVEAMVNADAGTVLAFGSFA